MSDLLSKAKEGLARESKGGARVSSGRDSKQDYETPEDIIWALKKFFNEDIEVDLAATPANNKAPIFITPEENSLKVNWRERFGSKLCFLNPPFYEIAPWARKCSESGCRILFLTPASVDSNWWDAYVHNIANVLFVKPRIKFVGAKDPYPKPCSISCYGFDDPRQLSQWYQPWQWK